MFIYVSFTLGGEAGARLLGEPGVTVSGDKLLGHIRSLHSEDPATPRILSVDDFAFRRVCRWGTVLVDLERHTLVDILPDRSADSFANWLSENPDVEVMSRDRGGEDAEAARRVAPDAVQVADRFHLLKNLRDIILRVFNQHSKALDLVPTPDDYRQRLTNLRLDRKASKSSDGRDPRGRPLRGNPNRRYGPGSGEVADTAIFAMPHARRSHLSKFVDRASRSFRNVTVISNLAGVTTSAIVARDFAEVLGIEMEQKLL